MKKTLTTIVLALGMLLQLSAQNISGYVTDMHTGAPLEGVSIKVTRENDTTYYKSAVTDGNGYYKLHDIILATTSFQKEENSISLNFNNGRLEVYTTSEKAIETGKIYTANGAILAFTKFDRLEPNTYHGTFKFDIDKTNVLIFSDGVNPAYKFRLANGAFVNEDTYQTSTINNVTLRGSSITNSEIFIFEVNDPEQLYEPKTFNKSLDLATPNKVDIQLSKPEIDNILGGAVQIGPFISGSTVRISELTSNLFQTGRSFTLDIEDNIGSYEIDNRVLSSNYLRFDANGYYFNPITGTTSNSAITIKAIADITNKSTSNVNVLTHLEKNRVEYLVSQGVDFTSAKQQAQTEVLKVFAIDSSSINSSELLDITKYGDGNAMLLAISVITQGLRTEGELTELLSLIGTDLKDDGLLNDTTLGSQMMQHVQYLDLEKIRTNLETKIIKLGLNDTIPDFEKYITQFINKCGYGYESLFSYPATTNYGRNILNDAITECTIGKKYSVAADTPEGLALRIVIKGGVWYLNGGIDGPINWQASSYNKNKQTFTSYQSGLRSDLKIEFPGTDGNGNTVEYITIEYYENLSSTPTKTKKIRLVK